MTNVLKLTKKVFTVGVVATTIVWSLGVAALVPTVANAATCPTLAAGDMIKVTGKPAIYVVDNNLKPRYFDNGDVFKSWRPTYGGYISITMDCYDSLGTPSVAPYGISYRPGSYIVKRGSSDQLYVVEPNNTLATITVAAAKTLYGATYKVMTISDQDWPNYVNRGTAITEAKVHPGMLISNGGKNWYVDTDMKLREVTETGMTANGFQAKFVRPVTSAAISGLTTGDSITAEVKSISDKSQSGGVVVTPGTTVGNLSVSLAADTPAGMTVPGGATGVEMLKVNVNGSGIVNQLMFKRMGIGSGSDFNNVYLYNGNTRLSSGRSVASDTNTVTFGSLNVTLPATLSVVADFTTNTSYNGNSDSFGLVQVNAQTVSGVNGNTFSLNTNSTASSVTVDDIGGNWQTVLGTTGAEVAKFKIAAGNNDVSVKRVVLRQGGSLANTNLGNLKLSMGSSVVATASSLTGDKLVLALNPALTIVKNQTKNFTLTGDILGGRTTDNIKFYVDEVSDVLVVDSQYNVGALVTNSFVLGNQIVSMTGGQITMAANGPTASNLAVNTTNNTLLKIRVSSERNVTVRKAKLTVNMSTSTSAVQQYVKNVKLVDLDSGYTLVGPADLSSFTGYNSTTSLYKEFTDTFDLTAGKTRNLAVMADFNSDLADGTTIAATLDLSGTNYLYDNDAAEYMSSTKIVPSTISGYNMTASTAPVTISKTATPASSTQVKGTSGVNALGISLAAGTAQNLKLNKLTVYVYGDGDGTFNSNVGGVDANTLVGSVSLWDGSTQLGTSQALTLVDSGSDGYTANTDYNKADFNNLNLPITAGSNKQLTVKVDLRNSFSGTNYVAVDVDKSTIEIENADGNLLTGSAFTGNLNLSTSPSPVVTAYQNGTLTAAVDGNTPAADVVLTGASNVSYSTYRFSATKEAFTITGAKIVNSSSTYDATFGLVTLEYKNKAGSTVTKTGYLSSGALTFNDGQLDIYVPVDSNVTVTVKANLNKAVDAGTSGTALKLGFEKVANQFGTSDTLANSFIAVGESSGVKVYGTSVAAFVDSTVNSMTAHKTKVTVKENDASGLAHATKVQDIVGVFAFTSESEAGSSQNSTLGTTTLAITGNLIAASGTTTVSVYSETLDAANLMGSATMTFTTSTGASTAIPLTAKNEWSGVKNVLVVVDTTGALFTDSTNNTEKLSTTLSSFTWTDGTGVGALSPIAGLPVYGDTYSY